MDSVQYRETDNTKSIEEIVKKKEKLVNINLYLSILVIYFYYYF